MLFFSSVIKPQQALNIRFPLCGSDVITLSLYSADSLSHEAPQRVKLKPDLSCTL